MTIQSHLEIDRRRLSQSSHVNQFT
jgi:hypothetical protein